MRYSSRTFYALLAAGIVVFNGVSAAWAAGKDSGAAAFSLDVKNMPLTQVFQQVSDKTGYRITVNEEYENHPVTAKFGSLPLEKGLRQILRSFGRSNVAMVIEEEALKISVYIYKSTPSDRKGPYVPPPVAAPLPPVVDQAETPAMEPHPAESPEKGRPQRSVPPKAARPVKPLPGDAQQPEEATGENPAEGESDEPEAAENILPEETQGKTRP